MIPIKFNVYPGDNNVSGNKLQNAFDHLYPRRTSEKNSSPSIINTEVFRREVQKFMRGLSILEGNFNSIYIYQDILQITYRYEKKFLC